MEKRTLNLLAAAAALLGKSVTDEEQATTELTAFHPEVARLRSFATDVGTELGETDPAKALAKVKQLKADSTRLTTELAQQKSARVKADVDATLTKHEKRITPATKEYFRKQLTSELESGVVLDRSETVKAIEALPEHNITERKSGPDVDDGKKKGGDKVIELARTIMRDDPEIRELHLKKGFSSAFREATLRAEQQLGVTK